MIVHLHTLLKHQRLIKGLNIHDSNPLIVDVLQVIWLNGPFNHLTRRLNLLEIIIRHVVGSELSSKFRCRSISVTQLIGVIYK